MSQNLIFSNQPEAQLTRLLADVPPHHQFVLVDENTAQQAWPLVAVAMPEAHLITIEAGDAHKTLSTLTHVWQQLEQFGATRQSVLVNVGGGVVTDLGGMAAATFKRGMRFINVPTTLMGAVDAAIGGKTGINFNGLKNELGVFAQAGDVLISTLFFDTLPRQEFLSGYAEVVKHALLSDENLLSQLIASENLGGDTIHHDALLLQLQASVAVKQRIVAADPFEEGLRKVLNLGHTVGHALESFAHAKGEPLLHGHAVAWGLVAELVLSHMALQFASTTLHRVAHFVSAHYPPFFFTCDDYPTLLALMQRDKKSRDGEINCTLLQAVGTPMVNQSITHQDMSAALDITRDFMGI